MGHPVPGQKLDLIVPMDSFQFCIFYDSKVAHWPHIPGDFPASPQHSSSPSFSMPTTPSWHKPVALFLPCCCWKVHNHRQQFCPSSSQRAKVCHGSQAARSRESLPTSGATLLSGTTPCWPHSPWPLGGIQHSCNPYNHTRQQL